MSWSKPAVAGTPPTPRAYASSVLIDRKLFVHGGSDGSQCLSDVHLLDVGSPCARGTCLGTDPPVDTLTWRQVDQGPKQLARLSHSTTAVGGYIFSIGGHNSSDYSNDVSLLNLGIGCACEWRSHHDR